MNVRIKLVSLTIAAVSSMVLGGCGDKEGDNGNIDVSDFTLKSAEATSQYEEPETTAALKVKDVVGKGVDNAVLALEAQGFKVKLEEQYSDQVGEGYVISQQPSADNDLTLSTGDTITLTVSKGKEPQVTQYLDSIVYADFATGSKYNKMSAYSGKDYFGNECTRAIKFECNGDEEKHGDASEVEQSVKVTYLIDNDVEKFSCVLAPLHFFYNFNYIHVNLYKDDVQLYSMDVSKDTRPLELEYDIKGATTFTIELTYLLSDSPYDDNGSIVFSEAKFE